MQRQIFLLLILFLLFCPSVLLAQTIRPAFYEDATAYEVYSAILSSREEFRLSKSKNFVIRLETNGYSGAFLSTQNGSSTCLRPDDESKKIIGTAIDNYAKVNKTSLRLRENFKLEVPYKLVSTEFLSSILKLEVATREHWDQFYKLYPDSGGFIEFSAVGFNSEKTVAVLYKGMWCSYTCGEGSYYVLQKKDGKWIPLDWKGDSCDWIS